MEFDPADKEPREAYAFLVSAVVPRPIAWVSTLGRDGCRNLAPFSFFNAFSANPMVLGIGIGRKRGGERKDTLRNVLETEEFVVNLVPEPLAPRMVATSAPHEYGVDEFEHAGLTAEPSARVRPPRVAESPVSLECVLYGSMDLDHSRAHGEARPVKNPGTLLLGEVVHVRVHDRVLDGAGLVDETRLEPVARMGGTGYWRRGERFDIARPG